MDINYYSPKRKLDRTSLLSLEGVLPNDIFEIVLEAERLETMARMKENLRFLSGKSAILYTDKPHNFYRVGFECAAHLLDCHSIIVPLEVSETREIKDLVRDIKLSENKQVVAEFFDVDFLGELLPYIADESRAFFDARVNGSTVFSLSTLLTLKKTFKKLSGLKVAVIEGKKLSSATVALAKSQAALTILGKEIEDEPAALEYLKQFVPIKTADSVKTMVKDADVIVFLSEDAAKLSEVLSEKDKKTPVVLSTYSPLFKLLEEIKEHEFSYEVAKSCGDIFAAILSLLA